MISDIPELADLESGRGLIRVPKEQNVPFTKRVRAIVDTPEFQRLGQISQLGLVSKVYPGARHTRFEHALGVYLNSLRYLQQLQKDRRFRELVDRSQAELLIVAALLHDLGHWPYCHPIEDMALEGMPPHEAYAARFLAPESELASVLQSEWGIDPADVLDLLVGDSKSSPKPLLRSILSGPIDVDKMDYLDRDGLHCGVPYGSNFDRQRLISSLVLNAAGDGLAITSKGKTAAELMVFARYVMFSEVYWHHAVRSATSMFARGFFELYKQFDIPELFTLTESEMIARLRATARGTPSEPLWEGVFGPRRTLYKRAAEFSHTPQSQIYDSLARRPYPYLVTVAQRLAEELSSAMGTSVAATEVLIDAPPPHREVEFSIDVLFPKAGHYRPLKTVSPVIEALARTQFDEWVKRVRVFVTPRISDSVQSLDFDSLLAKCL